jgi:hypothetical protein
MRHTSRTLRRSAALLGGALVAAGLLAGASALPAQAATCSVTALPVPDGTTWSAVQAADPTGRWLAGQVDSAADSGRVELWHDGTGTVLDVPGDYPFVAGITATGTVVGTAGGAGGVNFAWKYQHGKVTVLPSPHPGDSADAVAVDPSGDIAGTSFSEQTGESTPVLWPADEPGTVRTLATPAGSAFVLSIRDDRTVVGELGDNATDATGPYLWRPDGTGHPLSAQVLVVNTAGSRYLIGQEFAGDDAFSVRWDLATGTKYRYPRPLRLLPMAVNRHALVGGQLDGNAVLLRGQTTVTLPNLPGGTLGEVQALADTGLAAGWARDDAGVHAASWSHC